MKEGLEALAVATGILSALGGFLLWIVRSLERKAKEREASRQHAETISGKLAHLETAYTRMMEDREEFRKEIREDNNRLKEELEEVRRDFAQFVRELFFNK